MRGYSWAAIAATFVLGLAVAAAVSPNANAFNGYEDHTVTAAHSSKCLDREYTLWIRGVKRFNPYDGAGAVQSTCETPGSPARICTNPSGCEATNQIWKVGVQVGNTGIKLLNKMSGKCLDVEGSSPMEGARVVQMPCVDDDTSQMWTATVERTYNNNIEFYTLKNGNSGLCLEVAGSSLADAAPVVQGDCNDPVTDSQLWVLYNIPLGYFGI
jgi:hypothetical protein